MSVLLRRTWRNCISVSIKKDYSQSLVEIVKSNKIGRVTCIGLNNPQTKNSLNVEILTQLKTALVSFENDETSTVGVLYGEQGNFSKGLDPNEIKNTVEIHRKLSDIVESFCKKPILAAVSGFTTGLGFDLALWCDFRIVEETAVLAGYSKNFGIPVNENSAKLLCSLIGVNKALDLVLTGRIVKAKEAFDNGIATRIVACGTGLGQAVNVANSLANMPQACLRSDRATILNISNKFSSPDVQEVIRKERNINLSVALEELKDGVHITKSGDVRRKESKLEH